MTEVLEQMGEGRQVVRDSKGRIKKMHLTPEAARDMAQGKSKYKIEATSDQLLQEAGYTNDTAPEHLRLLAEIASSRRSGAVPALRDFRQLTNTERSKPIANTNKRKVELVGGFDFLIKVDGCLYRKVGPEAAEIARMIADPDVLPGDREVVASG